MISYKHKGTGSLLHKEEGNTGIFAHLLPLAKLETLTAGFDDASDSFSSSPFAQQNVAILKQMTSLRKLLCRPPHSLQNLEDFSMGQFDTSDGAESVETLQELCRLPGLTRLDNQHVTRQHLALLPHFYNLRQMDFNGVSLAHLESLDWSGIDMGDAPPSFFHQHV